MKTQEDMETLAMKEYLEEHGCPKCGAKTCKLTGTILLTCPGQHVFVCENCNANGVLHYRQIPHWKTTTQQDLTIGMMIKMGEDWRAYLRRQGVELDYGDISIRVYDD